MIEPIDLETPVIWIDPEDKGKKKTKWKFRPLTYRLEKFIQKMKFEYQTENREAEFVDKAENYLHLTLLGADNYNGTFKRDEDAEPIFDDVKPWSDRTLAQIPYAVRDRMISFVIMGYSELEKEELKN